MVDSQVAPEFEVSNGLRQGCVLAPTLFNLYVNSVIRQWRERRMEFGVIVSCTSTVVESWWEGEREGPSLLESPSYNSLMIQAAVCTSRESMESAAHNYTG